jgi:hypothetical protein
MGYDLRITRRQDPFDDQDPKVVSEAEWEQASSRWSDLAEVVWWSEGELFLNNPDREQIGRLIVAAQQLNARVVGDDGEVYTLNESGSILVDGKARSEEPIQNGRWWGYLAAGVFGLALIVTAYRGITWLLSKVS